MTLSDVQKLDRFSRMKRRAKFYIAQNKKCLFCGKFCKFFGVGSEHTLFTLEHVVPLRFGGKNYGNVVGACAKCNQKRATEIDKATKVQHRQIFENRYKENLRLQKRIIWN